MAEDVIIHYDMLIDEGNDSVLDPPELRDYMNKWDGDVFLEMLGIDRVKSVLEIGCGTGRLAMRVAPFVRSFCGVDISPKTIDTARGHLSFDNVRLICADFTRYQFDERFDIIYSSLTFMHISEKAEAIRKVSELLNVGGRFVLSIDKSDLSTA